MQVGVVEYIYAIYFKIFYLKIFEKIHFEKLGGIDELPIVELSQS
jgi:hypothetical protein